MYLMFLHVDHGSGEAISAIAKWKVEGTIDDIYGKCTLLGLFTMGGKRTGGGNKLNPRAHLAGLAGLGLG